MAYQAGFWDVEERLKAISAKGDPLETLSATVDFEMFRPVLVRALKRSEPSRGDRTSVLHQSPLPNFNAKGALGIS